MGNLTALQVRNARPGRHADGKGLYLLAKDSGAKSWVLRIVVNGRRRDFGLGPVDLVSLQEARDKAIEGRKLVRAGLDPGVEWKRSAEVVPTFEAAARACHTEKEKTAGWRNAKHGGQWLTTLERYAFPLLGRKRVDQIDHNDMWAVLAPIWQDKAETARRVRQRMAKVLDYAKAKGWRATEAPVRALATLSTGTRRRRGHFAALPYKRLPALMARLREANQTVGRMAVQFDLLTWARPGNVRFARWTEIDWDAAEWIVPGEAMKGGEMHVVPLVPAALDLLRAIQPLSGGGEFIFPGLKKGKPLSDATLAKAFRLAGGEGYTLHGTARSSPRDWAAERGFNNDWCEAALAHKVKDQTEAAYRRTAFLDHRRERLMPAWADFLDGQTNVVALAERRA